MKSKRFNIATFLVLGFLAVAFSIAALAQSGDEPPSGNPGAWRDPNFAPDKTSAGPAPKHDISGMWGTLRGQDGVQAGGVQAEPNDGKHPLPYSDYGLKVYKSHKPLEGFDA